jgi:MoxR-like ATPase
MKAEFSATIQHYSIACEHDPFPLHSLPMSPIHKIQQDHRIVGRDEELAIALAILKADRHLLLEGPVGVGKTTIALAVARHLERPTIRVDGDDRYTEAKLTGWFDPQQVLASGYGPQSFIEGPITLAMRQGAVLFINELNRMPESVQNVLLPALDERLLILPQIGTVRAQPGFLVVATQNPVEYIATGHLSEALKDRFEHVVLNYQSEDEETRIVRQVTACNDDALIREAVSLTRLTRVHPLFKKGASIRAAIAMVLIARHLTGTDRLSRAARAALATRVELRDEEERGLNVALDELLADLKKKA